MFLFPWGNGEMVSCFLKKTRECEEVRNTQSISSFDRFQIWTSFSAHCFVQNLYTHCILNSKLRTITSNLRTQHRIPPLELKRGEMDDTDGTDARIPSTSLCSPKIEKA